MTFGRPAMINKSCSTPVPSLIDDEYLSVELEASQPVHVPSRTGLLVYSCKLFDILADILESFYAANTRAPLEPDTRMKSMVSHALGYNRRLDEFLGNLPGYLKPTHTVPVSDAEKNHYTTLQQQVLYCR